MEEKITLNNVVSYIVGNLRYKLYYSDYRWVLRRHIVEQIDWRIKVMDNTCLDSGSCKLCGCSTTALQMANKSCDKPCYPEMMGDTEWNMFYYQKWTVVDKHGIWRINADNNLTFEPSLKD